MGLSTADITSTAYLMGAFGVIDKTNPVLLNLFFPMTQAFDTEEVYWDQIQRARGLAPLCVPTIAGKPQRSRGYQSQGVRPAYVKPKHIVEPIRAIKRRQGERLLGEMTVQQRFQLAIMDNMFVEDESITRLEEWMASTLLLNGTMLLQSPDFPPLQINLNRPAGNTIVLSGAATWGSTGVDPLGNMQDWAETVQAVSGFHPSTVVMDPKAARLFTRSPGVLTVMQSYRQTQGNVDLANKVVGGAIGQEVKYLGSLGEFDIWVYQQLYTDVNGNVQKLMPDYSVIMGNQEGAGGVRTYGAILDAESLTTSERFPKAWLDKDPSAWFTMVQSAPMPVLGWPAATFSATIVS
jgi:hypothetical protein